MFVETCQCLQTWWLQFNDSKLVFSMFPNQCIKQTLDLPCHFHNKLLLNYCLSQTTKKLAVVKYDKTSLRKKCPYSELCWSAFSHIRTEYGKIRTRITPNTDRFFTQCVFEFSSTLRSKFYTNNKNIRMTC